MRPRWDMFPLYLRVLDAEAAGLCRCRGSKILFPDVTSVYPDYEGKKKVSNALQRPRACRAIICLSLAPRLNICTPPI